MRFQRKAGSLTKDATKTACTSIRFLRFHKIGAIFLVLCLLLSVFLTACGSGESDSSGNADPDRKDAVAIGQWQESNMVSEWTGEVKPVKIRITQVIRDSAEVQAMLDDYNSSAMGATIPPLEKDSCAYAVAKYEVEFPSDFPDDEYGITAVMPEFSIVNAKGEPEITAENTIYEGLTDTWNIGPVPQGYDFHAGDTYQGAIVFIMVEGYYDFLIQETYPVDDANTAIHYYKGSDK